MMDDSLPRVKASALCLCAKWTRYFFFISTEAARSAKINPRTRPKKVTFSTTVQCNYHVLNSLTHPHLHPPLFFPFSGGFFFFAFGQRSHLAMRVWVSNGR